MRLLLTVTILFNIICSIISNSLIIILRSISLIDCCLFVRQYPFPNFVFTCSCYFLILTIFVRFWLFCSLVWAVSVLVEAVFILPLLYHYVSQNQICYGLNELQFYTLILAWLKDGDPDATLLFWGFERDVLCELFLLKLQESSPFISCLPKLLF